MNDSADGNPKRGDLDAASGKPAVPLEVLLIDDCSDFRALVYHHLRQAAPEITVWAYDPEERGIPDAEFDWRRYDVLLLDYQLGEGGDGLNWLAALRRRPGFPPTVLVTAEGDEYVAVRALKLGAEDYLRKQDITAEKLVEVIRAAAEGQPPRPVGAGRSAALEPAVDDQVVRGINHYKLIRKIGAGTQSRIYLGHRIGDAEPVAVKIIAVSALIEGDVLQRFEREASALTRIDSPHVVTLYEHAFSGDCGFLAMEYLGGGDLRARLRSEIEPARAVRYLRQLLTGLACIHEAGVLHRDLKPTNVMLRDEDTLVIADFGIARLMDASGEHTTEAMLLGTPAYMSPEQCLGQPVDERADLYSAGIMFYEMLMGKRPYVGRGVPDILYKHVHARVPLLPDTLARHQPVLNALLAKEPERRVAAARAALAMVSSPI